MGLPKCSVLVIILIVKASLAQSVPKNVVINRNLNNVTHGLAEKCLEKKSTIKCQMMRIYRPFDGTCSNPANPMEGAAKSAFSRLVPASYADGLSAIRKSVTGQDLPLPRQLVTSIFLSQQLVDVKRLPVIPNAGSVMFGQLLTHDVAFKQTLHLRAGIRCCTQGSGDRDLSKDLLHSPCLPLIIPKADKAYSKLDVTCLHNVRSQTVTPWGCPVVAQQINEVTSLLDLSVVYGSSKLESDVLRSMTDGLFNLTANGFLRKREGCPGTACFLAAEARANQTPFLFLWHLIWHREHNRIAKVFKRRNPFWSDRTLFQETRRLVIALYQHCIYKEYLPVHLSPKNMQKFKLGVEDVDFGKVGHVDGRTTNEFSHAIYRRFHNLLPGTFNILDDKSNLNSSLKIADVILNSHLVEKLYDPILRGMLNQTMNVGKPEVDFSFKLFPNFKGIGVDLFSLDIQRGRDHGLAPYHVYREMCGLRRLEKFEDLYPSLSRESIAKLREHYASVFDIDLVVGAGLEELNGEILGPTIQCIMAEQFHRYKFGDPYFYTNRKQPQPFSDQQMEEIKKFTLARLICDNSGLKMVPRNAFLSPSAKNPMVRCENVERLDLGAWKARRVTKKRKISTSPSRTTELNQFSHHENANKYFMDF